MPIYRWIFHHRSTSYLGLAPILGNSHIAILPAKSSAAIQDWLWSNWGIWGDCSKSCGGGNQNLGPLKVSGDLTPKTSCRLDEGKSSRKKMRQWHDIWAIGYGMILHDITWYYTILHDIKLHDITWYYMVLHYITRYYMILNYMILHDIR